MVQAIPMVIMAVGAAVSAVGAIKQGRAASAAAKYNSQVAEQNAAASRQAAAVDEARQRQLNFRNLGQMRANAAATGISMDSFADVFQASAEQAELDAQLIKYDGEMRARGYSIDSDLETARGKSARSQAGLTAAATLIQAAGSIGQSVANMPGKPGGSGGGSGIGYGAGQGLKRAG